MSAHSGLPLSSLHFRVTDWLRLTASYRSLSTPRQSCLSHTLHVPGPGYTDIQVRAQKLRTVLVKSRGAETLRWNTSPPPWNGCLAKEPLPLEEAGQPSPVGEGLHTTGTCGFLRLPDGHTDPRDVHGQGRHARRGDHGRGHGYHRRLCQRHLSRRGRRRLHLALCLQLRGGDPGLHREEKGSLERFRRLCVATNTVYKSSSGEKLTRLERGRPETSSSLEADWRCFPCPDKRREPGSARPTSQSVPRRRSETDPVTWRLSVLRPHLLPVP